MNVHVQSAKTRIIYGCLCCVVLCVPFLLLPFSQLGGGKFVDRSGMGCTPLNEVYISRRIVCGVGGENRLSSKRKWDFWWRDWIPQLKTNIYCEPNV